MSLNGFVGEDVDFANSRAGDGGLVSLQTTIRPTDHLELGFICNRRWLDVDAEHQGSAPVDQTKEYLFHDGRVFTADVYRLRANYTFTAKSFLRLIIQEEKATRNPALHSSVVRR